MKFIGKIKNLIEGKNNRKLSRLDALLENETIRSKYTRNEVIAGFEWNEAFERERKLRRQEDRRGRFVNCISIILGFVVINGSFLAFLLLSGIEGLLHSYESRFWSTLIGLMGVAIWAGYVSIFALTFCWLSDKTGLHYLIEDWVVSWDTWGTFQSQNIHKYKKFPRRKRRRLIRNLKKELDVIAANIDRLEREADDIDDQKLLDSALSMYQLIGGLVEQTDARSTGLYRTHLSPVKRPT